MCTLSPPSYIARATRSYVFQAMCLRPLTLAQKVLQSSDAYSETLPGAIPW